MKIENIRTRQQIVIPSSYPHCLDERDIKAKQKEQSSAVKIINQDISLREQILAIQKTKALLGISNQAATDTSMPRWHKLYYLECDLIKETYRTVWGDASGIGSIVRQMRDLASNLNNDEMKYYTQFITGGETREIAGQQVTLVPLMESNVGLVSILNRRFNPSWVLASHQLSEQTIANAATTLRYILEKGGDGLRDYDEAGLIKMLLTSHLREVRRQGAFAAENTYKHNWRKNIESTGLITAFKKEENDGIKASLASAIASADPKSILKEHSIEGEDDEFCPVTRCLWDRSVDVKINLAFGIGNVIAALTKGGKYFDEFHEVPKISAAERLRAFDYSLRCLEKLVSAGDLIEDEKKLFLNITYIIHHLIHDEMYADFYKISSSSQDKEFDRFIERLSRIDTVKFIKKATHTQYDDPNWKKNNVYVWGNSSLILSKILLTKSKSGEKVLNYYFSLREDVVDMIAENRRNDFVVSNLSRALNVIDESLENYLSGAQTEKVRYGSRSDFNAAFAELLERLKDKDEKDSLKLAALNFIEVLSTSTLCLSDFGNVGLVSALDDSNKPKLKETFSSVVHLPPISKQLFLNPPIDTPQGKALTFYRGMTDRSFNKDYYGMDDLKRIALEMACESLMSSSRVMGLLLSGVPRTGKSAFGEALASELAVPLEHIASAEVKEDGNKNVLIEKNSKKYTLGEYLEKIRARGRCIILIDEVDETIPTQNSHKALQFLGFLSRIKQEKLPVFIVATTNFPMLETTYGIEINKDGSSETLDHFLTAYVYPDSLKLFQPYYMFHSPSIGYGFAKNYIRSLLPTVGEDEIQTEGITPLKRACEIATGLTPLRIKTIISTITQNPLTIESISDALQKIKIDTEGFKQQREAVKTTTELLVSNGTHTLEGEVDWDEVTIFVGNLPRSVIVEILSKASPILSQSALLKLFNDAVKEQVK